MRTIRERAKDLAMDLQHEAQTHRIYAIIEHHLIQLLADEARDYLGIEEGQE